MRLFHNVLKVFGVAVSCNASYRGQLIQHFNASTQIHNIVSSQGAHRYLPLAPFNYLISSKFDLVSTPTSQIAIAFKFSKDSSLTQNKHLFLVFSTTTIMCKTYTKLLENCQPVILPHFSALFLKIRCMTITNRILESLKGALAKHYK